MKRTIILISAILFAGVVSGQSVIDYLLQAGSLKSSGKPDQAIDLLSPVISKTADSRLYLLRAEAYMIKGDYQLAASDYNSANAVTRNSGEFGLSRISALRGEVSNSLEHLKKDMNSEFKKSEKIIMLDPAFSKIENTPEWRQFWKTEWYSEQENGLSEVEFYLGTSKLSNAAQVVSGLEKNYPGDSKTLYARSLVNIATGKPAEAINTLSVLLKSAPSNPEYLRMLAEAQVKALNYAGASSTYSNLIVLEVPDGELYIQRAMCYNKTGELNKASSDIKKYLSLFPSDKNALRLAGKTAAASGDNLKALEYFSENLRLHPNDPECYNDRAGSYFVSKSWEWAIKDYTMSLDLEPGNPEVWLNKGISLLNLGRTEDACYDFRRSFNLGNKRATEYISRYCIK
jgi:Flp pilus assembly protein TadD